MDAVISERSLDRFLYLLEVCGWVLLFFGGPVMLVFLGGLDGCYYL